MAKKQTKADREEGRRIRAESRRREKEELRDLSPTPPPMSPPPRKPRARTINTLEGRVSPRTTATALKMSRGGLVQAKNLNRSIRGPNS
jgi:hypothetical protein